ncbi:MAG: sigma-70 family RNA polymerase sigma factor [Chloroflexota bacterium]|nr:sigma-70 family RNA polymerase sigma factor [Chloroflexota bacterium]
MSKQERAEERQKFENPIAHLLQLGRKNGYVTLDEILDVYPKAEINIKELEKAFAALLNAEIPYVEDEEDLPPKEENDINPASEYKGEETIENINTKDTVGLYIKEAGKVPLLTREEEGSLTKRIDDGRKAQQQLAGEGRKYDKEWDKLIEAINDGEAAYKHLMKANTRLVISIAKKYVGRGVSFLDLIQEGNIGMMRAALKFERSRGHKFSTYATWWIRQAITRAIADQGRTIRVPVHMGDKINKMFRMQHQLKQTLNRDPTLFELAEALNINPSDVEAMMNHARRPLSLEMPTGKDDDAQLGDFIADNGSISPEERATNILLSEDIREALTELPPRETRILEMRYGLDGENKLTLNDVGKKMGVTRERIRQIEAQALRRLRNPRVQDKLAAYLSKKQR